jgi:hypothetical protein
MGLFIDACNQVQRATGATVLAIHHTSKPRGKKTPAERGSYALRGAADAMIRVSRKDSVISVEVDKQKDEELGDGVYLRLKQVQVGTDPGSGSPITSCVLIGAADKKLTELWLGAGPLATLKTLVAIPEHSAESGEWRKAVPQQDGKSIPPKGSRKNNCSSRIGSQS